ncbi:hypothetical protein M426DRAFT_317911 [Hypoxylon sp. CI-4A]|nr:hypothetical protein M426DRAFT_317911 [Hypoxylon sp. CI-4A]
MHSIRRAAARAACSSSIAIIVPRQQVASFAVQIGKASTRPASILPLARYFSQTTRMAQDEKAAVEEAIESAEQTGSTAEASIESSQKTENAGNSIFVNNMTFDATEVHLREAFGRYGEIEDLRIVRDTRGLSRGFAFINFKDQEAANRAVEEADNSFWHGRRINVAISQGKRNPKKSSPSSSKPQREPSPSLYVGNIPYETSDADLNRLFKDLDNVKDVRVAVDRTTGWPRGFAHVDFTDTESAVQAREKLLGTRMGDRELRLDFAENRSNSNRTYSQGRSRRD